MNQLLVVVIVVLAVLTVVSLVRGIAAFLASSREEIDRSGTGPSPMQLKQSQMMTRRILYQGAAIVAAMLLLALGSHHG
jgi:flagellar basal body-associated protein FliL